VYVVSYMSHSFTCMTLHQVRSRLDIRPVLSKLLSARASG
jgi:hypothetical protein